MLPILNNVLSNFLNDIDKYKHNIVYNITKQIVHNIGQLCCLHCTKYYSILYMIMFWTLLNIECNVVCNFGCLIVHIVHIARVSFYGTHWRHCTR